MSGLKESMEVLLSLKDDLERAYSDPLGEKGVYEYVLKGQAEPVRPIRERKLESSNCHNCPLWQKRHTPLFYFNPSKADVLSVITAFEGDGTLLLPDAEEMYEKQMNAIGIQRSKRALSSLLKCPCDGFNREYADLCRPFLKEEMISYEPEIMILFGIDLAHYMLNNELPYEALRAAKRSFKVNGIRTYVTYSQRECINTPSLKRAVWDDLKVIGKVLN